MPSFEEILNKKASAIEPPKAYPVGTYHCLIDGPGRPEKRGKNQTDVIIFRCKILSAQEDVDAQEAATQQIVGKYIDYQMWVTEKTEFMCKDFLENTLGIEPADKTLSEMISEAPGKQLFIKLAHRASDDGKRVFHQVDSTAHV